jgi:dTMP kinase
VDNCEAPCVVTLGYQTLLGFYIDVRTPFDSRGLPMIFMEPPSRESFLVAIERVKDLDTGRGFHRMVSNYRKIHFQLFSGVLDREKIESCYHNIRRYSTAFSFGEDYSSAWGLIHAGAQMEALLFLARREKVPIEQRDGFFADLILREIDLYHILYLENLERANTLFRQWGYDRRESLVLWHSSWIDPSFFITTEGVLRGETVAISRAAIERYYRNPFKFPWIGLEGLDGSGKDTQVRLLIQFLTDVLTLQPLAQGFPTEGEIGIFIRSALRREKSFSNAAMQRLFEADRAEFLVSGDKPSCQLLVTGRHSASGIAYEATNYDEILRGVIRNLTFGWADLTIFIDTPVEVCLDRVAKRVEAEMFEREEILMRAAGNYSRLPNILPAFVRLDTKDANGGIKTIEQTFREIVVLVVKHLPDTRLSAEDKERLLKNLDSWCHSNQHLFAV